MKNFILNLFRHPTPLEMATKELVDAQRSKLEAETARDYASCIVVYNERRVERLEAYLKEVV